MSPLPICCHLGCSTPATHEIVEHITTKHPSECYTHACIDHVGELLTDAEVHTVVRLPEREVPA